VTKEKVKRSFKKFRDSQNGWTKKDGQSAVLFLKAPTYSLHSLGTFWKKKESSGIQKKKKKKCYVDTSPK